MHCWLSWIKWTRAFIKHEHSVWHRKRSVNGRGFLGVISNTVIINTVLGVLWKSVWYDLTEFFTKWKINSKDQINMKEYLINNLVIKLYRSRWSCKWSKNGRILMFIEAGWWVDEVHYTLFTLYILEIFQNRMFF